MGRNLKSKTHKIISLKNYKPSKFLIDQAKLRFELDPTETTVTSKLYLRRNKNIKSKNKTVELDGSNLLLQKLKLNNKLLSTDNYRITNETLTIFKVPDRFILEIVVKINPSKNLSCSGLYLSNGNFCTQNEPNGFRQLTYFIDRPDILTKFTTTIIADKNQYPVLLSNGNLIKQKQLANNKHSTIWQDPFPKSAYLFALVAGKFDFIEDNYTTTSKRKIKLSIFAHTTQLNQCAHAMSVLKQAMRWDETNFGLEYDLDTYKIVAIDDFNMGAMENKGLNIFNSNLLLASPQTTTDADFNRISAVVAHEYFHNWTGNRITCRDWFQIGLKEGLTTLREQLFMEDTYGPIINRLNSIKVIKEKQFPEDANIMSHPIRLKSYIEINNFYTVTVYYKGAEVARMLIAIFGKETFKKIIKNFLHKFDGQAATIDDLIQTATTVTKTNLKQFNLWYDQAGTPILNITDNFIAKKKRYALTIKQQLSRSNKAMYIPLEIGLINESGNIIESKTLPITKNQQTFYFPNVTKKPTPLLLRKFSAPIKITYNYSDKQLLFIIQHEQDKINIWQASQQLTTRIIYKLYKQKSIKKLNLKNTLLVPMVTAIIDNSNTDQALAAQMLQLPSENLLLEIIKNPKIEKICSLLESIKLELAKTLKNRFIDCYKNNIGDNPKYNLNAVSIGKRSLKNTCLHYLMYLNTDEVFKLSLKQLKTSNNLTDTLSCLRALANSTYKNKEQILENYYLKWRNQPNLVCKWLMINAEIKLPNTLERIKKLLHHKAFNNNNPNKVYALIRTFAEINFNNFHIASGAGYKFLADQVIAIDTFNPQLAAAIILPLIKTQKLDKKRQKLAIQQLKRISQKPDLSKNVYEIVSKLTSPTSSTSLKPKNVSSKS